MPDVLQSLRDAAEAERMATLAGADASPWVGAADRLAEAQRDLDAERIAADAAAAASRDREQADAFALAMRTHESLRANIDAQNRALALLEREFHAHGMVEARVAFDNFQTWRVTNSYAGDAEMIYRSLGRYPEHHFLASVPPQTIAKMREYGDLLKRKRREETMRANLQLSLQHLESQWPALHTLSEESFDKR